MSYDGVSRETIIRIFPELNDIPADVYEQIEIEARYAGYIKRQLADIEVFKKTKNLDFAMILIILKSGACHAKWWQN